MFEVTPLQIIQSSLTYVGPYLTDGQWILVYEHFCRKLREWHKSHIPPAKRYYPPYAFLNNTSGINCRSPEAIGERPGKEICERLAELFAHVGTGGCRTKFLEWLGVACAEDLEQPIDIHGWKPKSFPNASWFQLRGRWFRTPGPNSCHPKALWVMSSGLSFGEENWRFWVEYGYPHDSSSWFKSISQQRKEPLDRFGERIDQWLDFNLEPEDTSPQERQQEEVVYDRVRASLKTVFFDDYTTEFEDKLSTVLSGTRGTGSSDGRIELNEQRMATLLCWCKRPSKARKGKP